MSAIGMLWRRGLPLMLLMGLMGCGAAPKTELLVDTLREDTSTIDGMVQGVARGDSDNLPRWLQGREDDPTPTPPRTTQRPRDPETPDPVRQEEPETQPPRTAPARNPEKTQGTVSAITPEFRRSIAGYKQRNGDTVGWLRVPGTRINGVILQNPASEKNDYYLTHDIDGGYSRNGVFCADYRAQLDGGREDISRITALYGHSWDDNPDGTLFSSLKRYRDTDFAREHPYIFFSTAEENMVWEVFAVFETTTNLPYIRPTMSRDGFYDMMELIGDLTLYNYDSVVNYDDRILTLSTCTYSVLGHDSLPFPNNYRFVVMAKLVSPDTPLREEAVFAVNERRLGPDATIGYS